MFAILTWHLTLYNHGLTQAIEWIRLPFCSQCCPSDGLRQDSCSHLKCIFYDLNDLCPVCACAHVVTFYINTINRKIHSGGTNLFTNFQKRKTKTGTNIQTNQKKNLFAETMDFVTNYTLEEAKIGKSLALWVNGETIFIECMKIAGRLAEKESNSEW